jgi:N-acetylmuramoyl-L-alanine amidase
MMRANMRGWFVAGLALVVWAAEAEAIVLHRVRIRPGDPATVELSTSGPVVPWVRRLVATPDAPHRIYIDLTDTVLGPGVRKVLVSDSPDLVRVRTGQFAPTTARIVLDTSAELPYDVTATARQVLIALHPAPSATTAPTALSTPPTPLPTSPRESTRAHDRAADGTRAPFDLAREPPLIVVDAGHGGHDPGAEGVGGVQEKTVVLQIAHRLAAKLPARLPVESLLTRSDDSFVPLSERLPQPARTPILFLSLHANACEQPEPRGIEIFFGGPHGSRSSIDAKHLARLITTELRARLLRVRGRPRHGPFRVLTAGQAPSVLVEVGYLTDRRDAACLQDAKYQELFTDALVAAVATFLQSAGDPTVRTGQILVPSGNETRTIPAETTS